jgi:ribulose-5-phosphate 4-epimerase/fuculose-1-phosphate aldolase
VGRNVAEAYDRLYYMERVAQVQLYAMWTNRPLKRVADEAVDQTLKAFGGGAPTYGDRSNAQWHFDALKRILDRKEPDYKD